MFDLLLQRVYSFPQHGIFPSEIMSVVKKENIAVAANGMQINDVPYLAALFFQPDCKGLIHFFSFASFVA